MLTKSDNQQLRNWTFNILALASRTTDTQEIMRSTCKWKIDISLQIHLIFIDEFDSPNFKCWSPTWQGPSGSPPQRFQIFRRRRKGEGEANDEAEAYLLLASWPGNGGWKAESKPMEFGDGNGYHRSFSEIANSRTLQNEVFSRLWTWKLMLNTYEHIPLLGIHQLQCRVKTH